MGISTDFLLLDVPTFTQLAFGRNHTSTEIIGAFIGALGCAKGDG